MKYKFEDIIFNITEKKKPSDEDKLNYIGLEHLESGSLFINSWGSERTPDGEKIVMKKGDVLFGKRRAYQKKVAISPCDGIFSAHGMVLRPKEDVICKDFLPFFISSDTFLNEAIRISVGGLSPTINWKDIKELEFELPSIEDQKIISDKLWAAYELKRSYQDMIKATDEMVKSQFIEMLKGKAINGTISDLVAPKIANVKKTYSHDDTIKYIDISSINAEVHSVSQVTEYSVKNAPSRAQQCVKYGDLLVSTVRPINRNIAIVDKDLDNLVASTGFCVLRPNDGMLNYLLSIVLSDDFTNAMCDKANGGVYPAVNNGDVLNYQIHIPDDDLAKRASLVRQQADKSKFMRSKSQFIEMFGGNKVDYVQLSSLCSTFIDGDWIESKDQSESGIRLIQTGNVGCGEYKDKGDKAKYITEDTFNKLHCTEIYPGDILISRLPDPVGRACVLPEGLGKCVTAVDCTIIRFSEKILPNFFVAYTNTPEYLTQIKSTLAGTTRLRVSRGNLGKVKIPVPSIEQQRTFVSIAEQADKSKFELKQSIEAIDKVIKSLINENL